MLLNRREALARLGLLGGAWLFHGGCVTSRSQPLRLATFNADVTVPIGHGMMGGAWLSKSVSDPLEANGMVLLGREAPIVFVSVDWCEIRNEAYVDWQHALAAAAGTRPERVLISTVHQHDAPVADLEAEQILRDRKLAGTVCDPEFHAQAVAGVAEALSASLSRSEALTHIGTGQARVEKIASNRRYVMPDGQVRFDRMSATRNAFAIAADEGVIDPWLKSLSFWNGAKQLAALSFYAVHPMSYYGSGEVSADFPGLARRRRQAETGPSRQIYCSGCSGNVTAGKFNTGARENRSVLADRLYAAMKSAAVQAQRVRVGEIGFHSTPLHLEPRKSAGFTEADLNARLTPASKPFDQCVAAMGLSWRRRVSRGRLLQVPCIRLGSKADLLLLPGESYVEYQLAAQALRRDSFVCVAGYGDGATGYIPTEKHIAAGDTNLSDWCWVAPGSEARMRQAIAEALGVSRS